MFKGVSSAQGFDCVDEEHSSRSQESAKKLVMLQYYAANRRE